MMQTERPSGQRTIYDEARRSKRGQQLADLRRARIGDAPERLILLTIDDRAGLPGHWSMTLEELADQCELTERAVRYKLANLEARGLVGIEADGTDDAGRQRLRLTIIWGNVAGYDGRQAPPPENVETFFSRRKPAARRGRSTAARNTVPACPAERGSAPAERGSAPAERGSDSPLTSAPERPESAPPPTPSLPAASAGGGWGEVEAELRAEGLTATPAAVAGARRVGHTPQTALAVIDQARRRCIGEVRAFGEGAIFNRLTALGPDVPAEEGWPEPSEEYVRAAAAQRDRSRAAEDERKRAAAARLRELNEAEFRRRDELFGEDLDTMPEADLDQLAEAAGIAGWPSPIGNRGKPRAELVREKIFRGPLLAALAARLALNHAGSSPPAPPARGAGGPQGDGHDHDGGSHAPTDALR